MSRDGTEISNDLLAHRDDCYLLALRMCGNTEDAEDAVQDAYLQLLRFEGAIPTGPGQRTWLLSIVANAVKKVRIQQKQRQAREDRKVEMQQHPRPMVMDESVELREILASALSDLDEPRRVSVSLRHEMGLSYAEASAISGIPEGNMRVYAQRGLVFLREKLASAGYSVAPDAIIGSLAAGLGVKMPAALVSSLETMGAGSAAAVKSGTPGTAISATAKAGVVKTIAIGAAAAALIALSLVALRRPSSGAAETKADAGGPVAPTPAITGAGQRIDKPLADILDQKIDVICRRDHLSEVLLELDRRTGLSSAFPESISDTFLFSLESKNIKVKEILQKLSAEGNLELEYCGDTVVFWKHEDDKLLAALEKNFQEGNSEAKCKAVDDLAKLSDKRIYPILFRALLDVDNAVATKASKVLYKSHLTMLFAAENVKSLVEPLIKRLSPAAGEPDQEFVAILGETRDARAVDALLPYLKSNGRQMRSKAAAALGATRSARAIEPLLALLKDPAHSVRRGALKGLFGKFQDSRIIGPVIALLKDPDLQPDDAVDSSVLYGAEQVLGRIRDPQAIAVLQPLLADKNSDVRRRAATALAERRDPRSVELLYALLNNDQDSGVRRDAAEALCQMREARAIDTLMTKLNGEDQVDATALLAQSREPRALDGIAALLKSPDADIRSIVALTMADGRDPRFADAIARLLDDQSPHVKFSAALALVRLKDERGIDPLIAALHDPNAGANTGIDDLEKSFGSVPRVKAAVLELRKMSTDLKRHAQPPPDPAPPNDF